jgi:hypothetical protein
VVKMLVELVERKTPGLISIAFVVEDEDGGAGGVFAMILSPCFQQ